MERMSRRLALLALLGLMAFVPSRTAGDAVPGGVPFRFETGHLEILWGGQWVHLGEVPYFDLFPERDPTRFLPTDIPPSATPAIRDLHAQLRAANDRLWRESVLLHEKALKVPMWETRRAAERIYLLEGARVRMHMIESNGYHFFLDAVLALPADYREAWFDSIRSWQPPPIPAD